MVKIKFDIEYNDLPDDLIFEVGKVALEEASVWFSPKSDGSIDINISAGILPETNGFRNINFNELAQSYLDLYEDVGMGAEDVPILISQFEKMGEEIVKALALLKKNVAAKKPINKDV